MVVKWTRRAGGIFGGLCVGLLMTTGCGKTQKAASEDSPKAGVAGGGTDFDGGTYCVQTFLQGPALAQPLHFSNKETESDGSSKDFESDLSEDKLDVVFHQRRKAAPDEKTSSSPAVDNGPIHVPAISTTVADGFADVTQPSHFVRSDAHEWSMGTTIVAQGGTPWGLFISKPPVTKVGSESISGFDTDRYTVDTTHQGQLDKPPFLAGGQLKDYNITGTAWVAKQGKCILQYQIDYEEDGKEGTIRKVHYEGGVTKQ